MRPDGCLAGLELTNSPARRKARELTRLLQHTHLARLQTLRLDFYASEVLTVDTIRLVARLPQLRIFDVGVRRAAGAAFLQPLSDAPALTDLALDFIALTIADGALMAAIGGCAGLRRLRLGHLIFPRGTLLALCSSPGTRQLQHLELDDWAGWGMWINGVGPPDADEFQSAFTVLEQLQSLTLERVYGINALLPHLHRAPTLRLLSIRCRSNPFNDVGLLTSLLPSVALSALLTAAPHLEVRLLMPAALDRWLALGQLIGVNRAVLEGDWRELQRLAAELDRVTIVDEEPPSLN